MTIKINTHGNPLPVSYGDWTDLYTAEETQLKKFDFQIISLGIAMELPEGYYAEIVPRSSTFPKYGIIQTNGMGVIDNSYCGDDDVWKFPALAMRDTIIPKGERICQFRLVKVGEPIEFEEVITLGNESRGGFGSTGVK